ncbi:helical backbone metal receptor [Hydrogenoanaerobacterium sp.]|uniref:ABC transporter substrate-binding protein n=1 Tax=Hydrogenoanaerobacterium sp. TaxID=2953763 RepID=UPI002896CE22|nr:helical backbone metal receptor [Hydrogenoanaerobacterium sp.]
MKIKRLIALLLAFAMLLILPACSKNGGASGSEEDVSESEQMDESGNFPVKFEKARIKAAPERVVSLSPALTEIICDLGYFDKLAGVSDYCTYEDEDVESLTKVGTINAPDLDSIQSAKPDVVVAASPFAEADLVKLQQMNAVVVILPRAKNMQELKTLYTDIGRIFEGETDGAAKGKALFQEQNARVEEILSKVEAATINKQPQAAYLRLIPLTLATGDTFEGQLLEAIGFQNSAAAYGEWIYPQDKAVDLMPDILFYDKAIGIEGIKSSQIYNTTPAYANSKCFEYDLEVFERQGVRMFDMLEDMARQGCPDAFAAE